MFASLRSSAYLMPLALLLCGCSFFSPSEPSRDSETLGRLMVERLSWMDDVARAKQARGLPVTDPAREAALLRAMTDLGEARGLPREATAAFFAGQMAAARQFQKEWLADPKNGEPKPTVPPDLERTIRPALDGLGRELVDALFRERRLENPSAVMTAVRRHLIEAGYSPAVVAPALDGLHSGLFR